jgi:hypothetical protein
MTRVDTRIETTRRKKGEGHPPLSKSMGIWGDKIQRKHQMKRRFALLPLTTN